MKFEKKIIALRECCDLSQQDVASKLEISLSEYKNYELGQDMPIYILKKLIELYDISANGLLDLPAIPRRHLKLDSVKAAIMELAKSKGITAQELKADYQKIIDNGFKTNNPKELLAWLCIPCEGEKPTVEEYFLFLAQNACEDKLGEGVLSF